MSDEFDDIRYYLEHGDVSHVNLTADEMRRLLSGLAAASARADKAEAGRAEQEMISGVSLDQRDECLRELAAATARAEAAERENNDLRERLTALDRVLCGVDPVHAASRPPTPADVEGLVKRTNDAAQGHVEMFGSDYISDLWREAASAIAELPERRPAAIVQVYTGNWHLFEDANDAYDFAQKNPSVSGNMTVQTWHWHPAARPGAGEGCGDG